MRCRLHFRGTTVHHWLRMCCGGVPCHTHCTAHLGVLGVHVCCCGCSGVCSPGLCSRRTLPVHRRNRLRRSYICHWLETWHGALPHHRHGPGSRSGQRGHLRRCCHHRVGGWCSGGGFHGRGRCPVLWTCRGVRHVRHVVQHVQVSIGFAFVIVGALELVPLVCVAVETFLYIVGTVHLRRLYIHLWLEMHPGAMPCHRCAGHPETRPGTPGVCTSHQVGPAVCLRGRGSHLRIHAGGIACIWGLLPLCPFLMLYLCVTWPVHCRGLVERRSHCQGHIGGLGGC
jgi:hypothetical protein